MEEFDLTKSFDAQADIGPHTVLFSGMATRA